MSVVTFQQILTSQNRQQAKFGLQATVAKPWGKASSLLNFHLASSWLSYKFQHKLPSWSSSFWFQLGAPFLCAPVAQVLNVFCRGRKSLFPQPGVSFHVEGIPPVTLLAPLYCHLLLLQDKKQLGVGLLLPFMRANCPPTQSTYSSCFPDAIRDTLCHCLERLVYPGLPGPGRINLSHPRVLHYLFHQ